MLELRSVGGTSPYHRWNLRTLARRQLPGLLFVLGIGAPLGSSCAPPETASRTTVLRVATGSEGNSFRIGAALAVAVETALPGVSTEHIRVGGSSAGLELLRQRQADLVLAASDLVYSAFVQHESSELSGVAVLYPSAMHIVATARSGITALEHLRGRRIAVGRFRGADTEMMVRIVLGAAGLSFDEIEPVWLPRSDVVRGLNNGTIDAAFRHGGFHPFEDVGPVRLIPVTGATAHAIRDRYPFLRPMPEPPGVYHGLDSPVDCIGTDVLLVCRRDLDEQLVYDVTRVVVDTLPRLAWDHEVLRTVELDGMAATPIPLHAGAVLLYREQALFR